MLEKRAVFHEVFHLNRNQSNRWWWEMIEKREQWLVCLLTLLLSVFSWLLWLLWCQMYVSLPCLVLSVKESDQQLNQKPKYLSMIALIVVVVFSWQRFMVITTFSPDSFSFNWHLPLEEILWRERERERKKNKVPAIKEKAAYTSNDFLFHFVIFFAAPASLLTPFCLFSSYSSLLTLLPLVLPSSSSPSSSSPSCLLLLFLCRWSFCLLLLLLVLLSLFHRKKIWYNIHLKEKRR